MTRPIGPRDALRRLANTLKIHDRAEKELPDEEISSYVQAILKCDRASTEDLGDIVEIQHHMHEFNAEQQVELTEKLGKILESIFPNVSGGKGFMRRLLCSLLEGIFSKYPAQKEEIVEAIKKFPQKNISEIIRIVYLLISDEAIPSKVNITDVIEDINMLSSLWSSPLTSWLPETIQNLIVDEQKQREKIDETIIFWLLLCNKIPDAEERRKFFLEIPENKRGDFIECTMRLIRDIKEYEDEFDIDRPRFEVDSISSRSFIFHEIHQIPWEKRIQFIGLVEPYIKNIKDWHQRGMILHILNTMPEELRAAVVPDFFSLLEDMSNEYEKRLIVSTLYSHPGEQIANLVKFAAPRLKALRPDQRQTFFSILNRIPEEQRAAAASDVALIFQGIEKKDEIDAISGGLEMIPGEKIANFVSVIAPRLKDVRDGSVRAYILHASFCFSPEDRENLLDNIIPAIEEEQLYSLAKILQFAFDDEEIRTRSHQFLEKTLQSTLEPKVARRIASIVQRYSAILGIHDEHPLMQEAIRVLTLTEDSTNPKNPYVMYKHLKELSQKEVSYPPPEFEVEGQKVSFDLATFQSGAVQEVFRKDLPEVKPDALKELTKDLDDRLEKLGDPDRKKVLEAIEKLTVSFKTDHEGNLVLDPRTGEPIEETLSLDALKAGSFESSTLINLLSSEGDLIDITRAYFFVIISYIQSKPNELTGEELLTPREKALIQIGTLITHCDPGKKDGIFRYYHSLVPDDYKISFVQPTDVPEEQRVKKIVQSVVESELAKQFSEVFIQDLLRVEGPVAQSPHQNTYVKNLIGPIVGLPHQLSFDPHAGALYDDLIAKSREEVLDGFYQRFTADGLVKALQEKVVERIRAASKPDTPPDDPDKTLYNDIKKMLPGVEGLWDLDEDSNFVLTPFGALELLKQAGYIKT